MRLIDADELKTLYDDVEFVGEKWHVPIRVILANIDDMPTVDEMNICKDCRWVILAAGFEKHGHWVKISEGEWKCSNCDNWWSFDDSSHIDGCYKYCPDCGARMDEVINEQE